MDLSLFLLYFILTIFTNNPQLQASDSSRTYFDLKKDSFSILPFEELKKESFINSLSILELYLLKFELERRMSLCSNSSDEALHFFLLKKLHEKITKKIPKTEDVLDQEFMLFGI